MKTTRYFDEQVLRNDRISIPRGVQTSSATPVRRVTQADGRIRCWEKTRIPGDDVVRFLRVVTLEDGETVHNAFFDRSFRTEEP